MWLDGCRQGSASRQPLAAAQPSVVKVGESAIVRFDGEANHLRLTGGKDELKEFTAFIVVAPRANPGDFRGSVALNAPNGRDYDTGITIDMGLAGTPRFTYLNVEGKGLAGAQNLLKPGGDFGKLYQLELWGRTWNAVRLASADDAPSGTRPWLSGTALSRRDHAAKSALLHQWPREAGSAGVRPL